VVHIPDDRLSAFIDGDVLDPNGLIASAPVSLERLYLRGKSPGELVKGTLGAILLRDSLHAPETKGECHGCCVNRSHLSREQGFHLISRLHPFDH
jgi:hypothetical protein